MWVELVGAYLNIRPGKTEIVAHEPRECPRCHRMTAFFTNERGESTGTCCAGLPRKE